MTAQPSSSHTAEHPSDIARDDRVQIYVAAVKAGGLLRAPLDVTLDVLPDDAFATARQLLVLLRDAARDADGQPLGLAAADTPVENGYAYQIRLGRKDWRAAQLVPVFQGCAGRVHPAAVDELQQLLVRHARPQDFRLKP